MNAMIEGMFVASLISFGGGQPWREKLQELF